MKDMECKETLASFKNDSLVHFSIENCPGLVF